MKKISIIIIITFLIINFLSNIVFAKDINNKKNINLPFKINAIYSEYQNITEKKEETIYIIDQKTGNPLNYDKKKSNPIKINDKQINIIVTYTKKLKNNESIIVKLSNEKQHLSDTKLITKKIHLPFLII